MQVVSASQNIHYSDLEAVKTAASSANSTFEAYLLTGGIWVENQPLLVNKEFNFSMAMGIEGVGPAIAAGTRRRKNEELAQKLTAMPPISINDMIRRRLANSEHTNRYNHVTAYAMLYGQPKAQIMTVVELDRSRFSKEDDSQIRVVLGSEWQNVESWIEENGRQIQEVIELSTADLILSLTVYKAAANKKSTSTLEYLVEGGQSVRRGDAIYLQEEGKKAFIIDKDIPNTLLVFPIGIVAVTDQNRSGAKLRSNKSTPP